MNFPDSFKLEHKVTAGESVSWETVVENYPCRFTILDAFSTMSWAGNNLSGSDTHANLRVPLTLIDFPEEGFWLDDYRVTIQRPFLPRMTETNDTTWDITGKRLVANHVLYLLKL